MDTATPPEIKAHTGHRTDVNPETRGYETLDHFMLIEHDFLNALTDEDKDVFLSYNDFKRLMTQVAHGNYQRDEIHTALIMAEDHIEVLLEYGHIRCHLTLKLANRALALIKKMIRQLFDTLGEPEVEEVAIEEDTATETKDDTPTKVKTVTVWKWQKSFTQVVELVDAIMANGCVAVADKEQSSFVRSMFSLMGVEKTPTDFYKARHKLSQKTPKKGGTRCVLLPQMLEKLESDWEERYMSTN